MLVRASINAYSYFAELKPSSFAFAVAFAGFAVASALASGIAFSLLYPTSFSQSIVGPL